MFKMFFYAWTWRTALYKILGSFFFPPVVSGKHCSIVTLLCMLLLKVCANLILLSCRLFDLPTTSPRPGGSSLSFYKNMTQNWLLKINIPRYSTVLSTCRYRCSFITGKKLIIVLNIISNCLVFIIQLYIYIVSFCLISILTTFAFTSFSLVGFTSLIHFIFLD